MSKIHSQTRIIDNKGTSRFASYCANHEPQISWRSIPNDDIGIDGEVEFYDVKGEPFAEIIKIQLKSTERDKGYIKNENPNTKTFTFYAERDHVQYWQELQNDVILVIYDNRNGADQLYAKKIENIDLKNIGTHNVPIKFYKEQDAVKDKNSDFVKRFSRRFNASNPIILPIEEGTERLTSNLLKILFPNNSIYTAPISYDRDEVIKKSWETERPLRFDASARSVAVSALVQQGSHFPHDWTIFKKQIVTFHNLNDPAIGLTKIIDTSLVERFAPDEFCDNEDRKNVFKTLLRRALQHVLHKGGKFEWISEEGIFRFIAPEKLSNKLEIKEKWKGAKTASRTVLKVSLSEKTKRFYCTHFAFEADFKEFNGDWYICINPTWAVSIDGKQKSRLAYKEVSKKKKLERNQSVLNHLRFIVYQLIYRDMFTYYYQHILFDKLDCFIVEQVIHDSAWIKAEDKEELQHLEDGEAPNENEFKNENTLFG